MRICNVHNHIDFPYFAWNANYLLVLPAADVAKYEIGWIPNHSPIKWRCFYIKIIQSKIHLYNRFKLSLKKFVERSRYRVKKWGTYIWSDHSKSFRLSNFSCAGFNRPRFLCQIFASIFISYVKCVYLVIYWIVYFEVLFLFLFFVKKITFWMDCANLHIRKMVITN